MKTNYLYSLCKDALHVFLTKCILYMMLGNLVFFRVQRQTNTFK